MENGQRKQCELHDTAADIRAGSEKSQEGVLPHRVRTLHLNVAVASHTSQMLQLDLTPHRQKEELCTALTCGLAVYVSPRSIHGNRSYLHRVFPAFGRVLCVVLR